MLSVRTAAATRIFFVAATLGLAACELDTVNVPKTAAGVVVHAVLNPGAPSQVVLVERTLTGEVTIPDSMAFDATDPIASAGGIPVSGATVEIVDSTGRVTRGIEDRTVMPGGKGAGVYRVPLLGGALVLGARYELRIHVPTGEILTAATRVPRPPSRVPMSLTRGFNRDHDAIFAAWSPAATARSYAVRIESPFGPFFLFTDSLSFRLTGDLRNLFAGDLQRVFIPGFRQEMIIAAVDSNFYDYYRTNNDPFTGSGIISRVDGGLGMFGAIVNLSVGTINVSADITEPIEGRFLLRPPTFNPNTPTALTLYVESAGARSDLPAALSGRYILGGTSRADGLLGRMLDGNVSLAFLGNQLAGDTIDVFDGQLSGDTLRGTYRKSGESATFVKDR